MKEIIKQNNAMLLSLLIPKGDEPIAGSVTDPISIIFKKTNKQ